MEFYIPKHIDLKYDELVVACYTFGKGLPLDEMLVHTTEITGHRKAFLSLCPGNVITDEVLTMVCSYLSHKQLLEDNAELSFLPPDFSASLLAGHLTPEKALDKYQFSFLQSSRKSKKVFIPLKDECDWYLLVVDMKSKETVILEPYFLEDRIAIHEEAVTAVMKLLDNLAPLLCSVDGQILKISYFDIIKPYGEPYADVPQDSGVWVCQWMLRVSCLTLMMFRTWMKDFE
ncbi:unnamed protein product [Linum trigynum]|uniref:Ubiquitin-like protease family profile domain-containing protein n=1 Tax=Linum trigynum TaxID=586398 RepID=A0AAV2DBD5_9ROSI